MKIARFFGWIFGVIGTLVMLGSVGLCFASLNAPVRMDQAPEGAVICAQQLADAISQKDYAALERCLSGRPALGLEGAQDNKVWQLHEQKLTFSWTGECYASNSGIFRDAVVTYLDIPSLTEQLQTYAHSFMTQKVESAAEMEELYDETGEFRKELVDQVLEEALAECIRQNVKILTKQVTVELVRRDDMWFAVPDTALLDALAGGLT